MPCAVWCCTKPILQDYIHPLRGCRQRPLIGIPISFDREPAPVRDRPSPSFRESSSLEQDADIAMLMYLSEPDDRVLRLVKNKEGQVGKILMAFHGAKQTVTERVVDDSTFRPVSDRPNT